MRTVVLAGYREGSPRHETNWRYVQAWWERFGFEIFTGDREGAFSIGAGTNRAAALAGDWDVGLCVGTDFILGEDTQVPRAIGMAQRTGQLTFAHSHLVELDWGEAERLISTGEIEAGGTRHPNTFSGILAVPRQLWDAVGGFDERFVGWGFEDLAFWSSCWALAGGFQRVPGNMYHLWHPRSDQSREKHPQHAANEALGRRYLAAKTNRKTMLEIIAEREQ